MMKYHSIQRFASFTTLPKLSLAIACSLAFCHVYAGTYYHYNVAEKPNDKGLYLAGTAQGDGLLNSQGQEATPFHYERLRVSDNHVMTATDKQYNQGLLDENGTVLAPFIYESIADFTDGLAPAYRMINGKKMGGYLNPQGKEAVPFIYQEVNDFRQGRTFVKRDGRYFILEKTGKQTPINPAYQVEGYPNHQEIFRFFTTTDQQKYQGAINLQGQIVIPPIYQEISMYDSENRIKATKPDGKVDYFTKQGKPIAEAMLKERVYNSESIDDTYIFQKDQKYGITNPEGNIIAEPIYARIQGWGGYYFAEKRDPTSQLKAIYEGGYNTPMAYYDTKLPSLTVFDGKGKVTYHQAHTTFKPTRNQFGIIEHTVAGAERPKQGVIHLSGKTIIPAIYNYISPMDETNLFTVLQGDKVGVIDTHGHIIVPFGKYAHIQCYNSCKKEDFTHFYVQNDLTQNIDGYKRTTPLNGLVDKTGREVLPPIYHSISIKSPYLIVTTQEFERAEKYGAFSFDGKTALLPPIYKKITASTAGNETNLIITDNQNKFGIMNNKGKFIAGLVYDDITDFKIGKTQMGYVLIKDRLWGIIDEFGKPIMPINNPFKPMDMGKLAQ